MSGKLALVWINDYTAYLPKESQTMIRLIISDLSEVLVSGLYGIEVELQPILGIPQDEILPCFGGNMLTTLFVGRITEDEYLSEIISEKCWPITVEGLKETIRRNLLLSESPITPDKGGELPLSFHTIGRSDTT